MKIGITGHRDIIKTVRNKEDIQKFLLDLARKKPNEKIQLLSPLADGADRYVAEIMFELKKDKNFQDRLELIVPMPFELEEYQKDFDEKSKQEFNRLLSQAKEYFFVGYAKGNDSSIVDKQNGNKEKRRKQYFEVGKYVADHSDILLALWDGKDIGKVGGTDEIVQYKLNNQNPLVLHIYCDRASSKTTNLKEYTVKLLSGKNEKIINY